MSRIFLKGLFFASESDSSGAGTRLVKNRYVSGSFVAGTSALSPGVPRHLFSEQNGSQAKDPNVFQTTAKIRMDTRYLKVYLCT